MVGAGAEVSLGFGAFLHDRTLFGPFQIDHGDFGKSPEITDRGVTASPVDKSARS